MTTSGMVAVVVSILTMIFIGIAEHLNPQLRNFYGDFYEIPLFFVLTFLLILFIIYKELYSFFTHEKKEINVETTAAQKEEEESIDSVNRDMYLNRHIISSDLVEYQILNKNKEIVWLGKGHINQGKIHSILLYAGESDEKIVLQVVKGADDLEYLIQDDRAAIGSIKIINNGLIFNNPDNKPLNTAALEIEYDEGYGPVADVILTVLTNHTGSSAKKIDFIVLRGETDEILGKYFIGLRNIDLTADTDNKFDRRIAAIFSILLDHALFDERSRRQTLQILSR